MSDFSEWIFPFAAGALIGVGTLLVAVGIFVPPSASGKFAADCAKSTIQTQYAEQQGKRAMIVQCERAK